MKREPIAPFWFYFLYAFVVIYWGAHLVAACHRGDIPACAESTDGGHDNAAE